MAPKTSLDEKRQQARDRLERFRGQQGASQHSRYEILATEETKAVVREIAKAENLTPAVAAEALLNMGIDLYLQQAASATGIAPLSVAPLRWPAPVEAQPLAADVLRSAAPRLSPSGSALVGSTDPAVAATLAPALKSLKAYSTRTPSSAPASSTDSSPPSTKAAAAVRGFFERAQARKKT